MLTVYSDDHRLHFGQSELVDGKLQPCFEMPSRADTVLARVKSQNLGEIIAPKDFGREPLLRIHDAAYLDFLQGAWARWAAEGHSGDLVSTTFPGRRLRRDGPIPTALMGEVGHYSFDTEAPITAGTWQAMYSSAQVALTAQDHMRQGASTAFALCRPPGHHAGGDFMGGYCFLNNAAIATQAFLDQGARRVAILDVDYHHGNGTQDIFYRRNDVLFASIHGDPRVEYPYFLGHANERGEGAGEGCNHNYPLPHGSGWDRWFAALDDACVPQDRRLRAGRRGCIAGRGHLQGRPDFPVQAGQPGLPEDGRAHRRTGPPDPVHHGRGLRGGGHRHQRGERAAGLRRRGPLSRKDRADGFPPDCFLWLAARCL